MMNILDKYGKDGLPILTFEIQVFTLATKQINVAIIDVDAYHVTCKLKRAEIFAISIRNLEYQVKNKARSETDMQTAIPAEYHDLLDIFFKNTFAILPPHQKYDHKILLEQK